MPHTQNTPTQICSRCKELVPLDRKSCPIGWKDSLGSDLSSLPKAQPMSFLSKVGIGTVIAGVFALWIWNGLVSLKAYDIQAVPREKADLVKIGMTHQQIVDLLGRDAVPLSVWAGFQKADDPALRAISESAKESLETRHVAACSPDRDAECGAHYTLKDGSGLRIIYHRGIAFYTSIDYGYRRGTKRF